MLQTRVITGVVLLAAFAADLFLANFQVFALVLGFVVAAAAWEWSRLCKVSDETTQTAFAAGVGVLALVVLYIPYNEVLMRWILLIGFLYWLNVPIGFYMTPKRAPFIDVQVSLLALGVFVMLVAAIAIQYLRSYAPDASSFLLLYALCIVWIMDIGAYFSGKQFGRNKLAPQISPGKTWEGVYGGLLCTFLFMLVVLVSAGFAQGNAVKLILATLLAAAVSVVGDLAESRIKRAADMKDSSQMLPGHGGVLDRIDGVLSAVPVFAFVWAWL
ncbi:MAG: phosphatidate cytidylyltransferase [Granulosicoccus sp.]